uniref:Uncharacterized protein n=1 Tax=Megaselia scalaris TaxID=36166 RepID=T1H3M7_MEGSC
VTKTLLNKRVNKLVIIDTVEKESVFHDLKVKYQNTVIIFERLDTVNVKAVEIQAILQKVVSRIQYIDVFINGLEVIVEKDLQRTMNVNMQVYLTFVMLVRDIMDRTKGGHGGVIVNLLSNMGMQVFGVKNYNVDVVHNVQQYLINKQMLLSLSKTVSQEWFYQQTGV